MPPPWPKTPRPGRTASAQKRCSPRAPPRPAKRRRPGPVPKAPAPPWRPRARPWPTPSCALRSRARWRPGPSTSATSSRRARRSWRSREWMGSRSWRHWTARRRRRSGRGCRSTRRSTGTRARSRRRCAPSPPPAIRARIASRCVPPCRPCPGCGPACSPAWPCPPPALARTRASPRASASCSIPPGSRMEPPWSRRPRESRARRAHRARLPRQQAHAAADRGRARPGHPRAPGDAARRGAADPGPDGRRGRRLSGRGSAGGRTASARPGFALVTVRLRVNESNEESLVKVYERLSSARGALPAGAQPPTVTLHSIDDVPFLALTLWTDGGRAETLRPLGVELAREIAELPDVMKVETIGGEPRVIRVEPDPDRMAAAGVTWTGLVQALSSGAGLQDAGTAVRGNAELRIEAGPLFRTAGDVEIAVAAVRSGRPVYVRDVARVFDGPDEATRAVFFSPGVVAGPEAAGREYPAVTVAVAKRPGANATTLAEAVLAKVDVLRPRLLPGDAHVAVTRNYGETAREKSNELVEHLLLATLSVVALISLAMGWRSGLVVTVAVPVTLALTLFIYFVAGYTLNRVTLFALIFSIGILVDDAIVVVENIERHHR